jgi:hypothetical protein
MRWFTHLTWCVNSLGVVHNQTWNSLGARRSPHWARNKRAKICNEFLFYFILSNSPWLAANLQVSPWQESPRRRPRSGSQRCISSVSIFGADLWWLWTAICGKHFHSQKWAVPALCWSQKLYHSNINIFNQEKLQARKLKHLDAKCSIFLVGRHHVIVLILGKFPKSEAEHIESDLVSTMLIHLHSQIHLGIFWVI